MPVTAFLNCEKIAQGSARDVAMALRAVAPPERASDLLAFDDETGRQVDLDLRPQADAAPRPRGRPALGVEAKEVTLLPRHWEWLAQHGGASATLRKLVEAEIRKGRSSRDHQDAAFRFLNVMAGDFPRFEDAVREIYAGNRAGYDQCVQDWPASVREHGRQLAFPQ